MADSIEGYGLVPPELPEVRILRLQPGDILLLTVDRRISDMEYEEIQARMTGGPFSGHQCAILEGGMTLDILRKEEASPSE